jgi:hypothetical protein
MNKLEAVTISTCASSLDEGNAPKGDWIAQFSAQAIVAAHQVQRHRHRHSTERGLVAEHIAEKDAVPEIDPSDGAGFTSYRD